MLSDLIVVPPFFQACEHAAFELQHGEILQFPLLASYP